MAKSGNYRNASQAVRDGLRALQQRRREDALKFKLQCPLIKTGVEALQQGLFDEVEDAGLDHYLESLAGKRHR